MSILNIKETNYDYVLESNGKYLKIPKKIWNMLSNSTPGQKLQYGRDEMTFKTDDKKTTITKSFNGNTFSWELGKDAWNFAKSWIQNPQNRSDIELAYKQKVRKFEPEIVPWNKYVSGVVEGPKPRVMSISDDNRNLSTIVQGELIEIPAEMDVSDLPFYEG